MTIRTAIQDFLVEIEIRKYTIKTQRGYKTNLNVFRRYCEEELQITDMDDLDMAVVKRFTQRMIQLGHKGTYLENFLQVSIDEWQEAFITLPRSSLGLYLYLCGNQNGFHLSLSSAAVQQALGISDSSYRRSVEDLMAAGYLIMRNNNERTLDFYTSPQPTSYKKKERKQKASTGGGAASAEPVSIEGASCEPPADEAFDYYASITSSLYR